MGYPTEKAIYAAFCHLYGSELSIAQARDDQRWADTELALRAALRADEDPRLKAAHIQLEAWKEELENLTLPLDQQLETGAGSYQELYLRYRRRCQQLSAQLKALSDQIESHQATVERILNQPGHRPALGKVKPALKPVAGGQK
jgi:hypothetical protein